MASSGLTAAALGGAGEEGRKRPSVESGAWTLGAFGEGHSAACAVCQFLRGSLAGAAAKTVVYPLDRLKVLSQESLILIAGNPPSPLISILGGRFLCSLRHLRCGPYSGVAFFSFDFYKGLLSEALPEFPKMARFWAGALAGASAVLATYPLDVLNTRKTVAETRLSYRQLAMAEEGLASLYRGLVPTLLGILPYSSIAFCLFESLKESCLKRGSFTDAQAALCGGLAGVVGQLSAYPLDTTRKLLQASDSLQKYKEGGLVLQKGSGWLDAAGLIFRERGLGGFFRGVPLCLIKGFTSAALAFLLSERIKRLLREGGCESFATRPISARRTPLPLASPEKPSEA